MSDDALFRSVGRHSRLRADKLALDLALHDVPLSDVQHSLEALHHFAKPFRRTRIALTSSNANEPKHELLPAGAREMSTNWIDLEAASSSFPAYPTAVATGEDRDTPPAAINSLAFRRRQRYRNLPLAVRCVISTNEDTEAPELSEEEPREEEAMTNAEHEDAQASASTQGLLHFRRMGKKSISRSGFDYLVLEGRANVASSLCRAVTTAEQEFRTKKRARVWRQEVMKIKSRHTCAIMELDEREGNHIYAIRQAHWNECAGALTSRVCDSNAHNSDDHQGEVVRQDSRADVLYERILCQDIESTR